MIGVDSRVYGRRGRLRRFMLRLVCVMLLVRCAVGVGLRGWQVSVSVVLLLVGLWWIGRVVIFFRGSRMPRSWRFDD